MDFKGKKILLVDDMMTMRKLVGRACKKMGIEDLIEAKSGDEAWEKLNEEQGHVRLIISDWNMPNGTGIEFLKKVRLSESPLIVKTFFIMLTAEKDLERVKEALDAGADNFISKPFSQEEFEERLSKAHYRRDHHGGVILPVKKA